MLVESWSKCFVSYIPPTTVKYWSNVCGGSSAAPGRGRTAGPPRRGRLACVRVSAPRLCARVGALPRRGLLAPPAAPRGCTAKALPASQRCVCVGVCVCVTGVCECVSQGAGGVVVGRREVPGAAVLARRVVPHPLRERGRERRREGGRGRGKGERGRGREGGRQGEREREREERERRERDRERERHGGRDKGREEASEGGRQRGRGHETASSTCLSRRIRAAFTCPSRTRATYPSHRHQRPQLALSVPLETLKGRPSTAST